MYDVKLPPPVFFENGNIYTGSLGTDPKKGFMNITTMHFRVQTVKTEETEKLCASCKFELPWDVYTNISEFAVAFFEMSARGIEIAENWISRKYFISKQMDALPVTLELPRAEDRGVRRIQND